MSLQMLQPFLGQNLEDSLIRSISGLDGCCTESKSASIGPFGVFDTNMIQEMNLRPEELLGKCLEASTLDCNIQASRVPLSNNSGAKENVLGHTAYHTWPEIMTLLDPTGTTSQGEMISLPVISF